MAADCFKHIRALIVDQNEGTRTHLAECFGTFGIFADVAASEHDVPMMLRKAAEDEQKPYNLIVVDFAVLSWGGVEYVRKIRNSPYSNPTLQVHRDPPDDAGRPVSKSWTRRGSILGVMKPVIPSVLYNGVVEIFKIVAARAAARGEKVGSIPRAEGTLFAAAGRGQQNEPVHR